MANGGAAFGRNKKGRVIFVQGGIPGEKVRVKVRGDKNRYAQGELLSVLESSKERVEPKCPHFGRCSGCHFQHISYSAQLKYKQAIIRNQLERLAGIKKATVRSVVPNPEPYHYRTEMTFSRTPDDEMGLWSANERQVIAIDDCFVIRPGLRHLLQDTDLTLPNLRKVTFRQGDDEALLLALETDQVEPPEIGADFPVSVSIVLPDGVAANLVGDNYVVQRVKDRDFRVSAGSFFYPSPPMVEVLVDVVLSMVGGSGRDTIIELYSGVGTLTAFLAEKTNQLIGIEANPDAIADAAYNLDHTENVTLYQGDASEIFPVLEERAELIVVDADPAGIPPHLITAISQTHSNQLVYISQDIATFARDSKALTKHGFHLQHIQPLDMYPQTFYTLAVSLWQKGRRRKK